MLQKKEGVLQKTEEKEAETVRSGIQSRYKSRLTESRLEHYQVISIVILKGHVLRRQSRAYNNSFALERLHTYVS